MDALVSYLFKSIISSGIFVIYYRIALRNKKFHTYNRFYLVSAMVISLLVPFLRFGWFRVEQPVQGNMLTVLSFVGTNAAAPVFSFTWEWIVLTLAAAISSGLLMVLFSKIFWIYKIRRNHPVMPVDGFRVILTQLEQAPFTFFNNLFWRDGISLDDETGKRIFQHEVTHIEGKHTYDKLFFQVATCIFWMNPFYRVMQKELDIIHEFIADARSVNSGDGSAFAQMLLQSHNGGRYIGPAHFFFQSSVKRRLTMITTSPQTRYSYMRRILVLPLAFVVCGIFSFSVIHAQVDPMPGKTSGIIRLEHGSMMPATIDDKSPAHTGYMDAVSFYDQHPAVRKMECTSRGITIYLKDNKIETYELADKTMMKAFSKKYGAELVRLSDLDTQSRLPDGNAVAVSPADRSGNALRVINTGGNDKQVITLHPNQDYVHVISGSGGEIKIDSIPVKQLTDKKERDNILATYGVH